MELPGSQAVKPPKWPPVDRRRMILANIWIEGLIPTDHKARDLGVGEEPDGIGSTGS